jgi:hypothetical protein
MYAPSEHAFKAVIEVKGNLLEKYKITKVVTAQQVLAIELHRDVHGIRLGK